jgi:hypothetical protein
LPPVKKPVYAQLTSWSFSVYQNWLKCPWAVCLEKIQRVRIQEPPNMHFIKGNHTHSTAEQFISGTGTKRPALTGKVTEDGITVQINLTAIKAQLIDLRKRKAVVEQEWAFDRQWNPCDWRDWKKAWLRIKTDACASATEPPHVDIVDWKTGKVHDEHKQQRSLYALGGLQLVQLGALAGGSKDTTLTAQHVYVDTGQSATEDFKFKDLAGLKREWLARTKPMMEDTVYRKHPGFACKWCKFSAAAGGPCEEGK